MAKKFTPEQIAKIFGVSVEAVKTQMEANAATLEQMKNKAVATGKKVNGYTATQLVDLHSNFKTV